MTTRLIPNQNSSANSMFSVESLVSALRLRASWPSVRRELKQEKIVCGQGWDDLLAKASEKSQDGVKLKIFLEKYFQNSIVADERFVQLYEVSKDRILNIIDYLKFAVVPSSSFSSTYPLPLNSILHSSTSDEPTLCEIRMCDNGDISLIFCSIRSFDDRQTYKYSELSTEVQKTYGGIDKLVTFRRIYYQAYDVVNIRANLERIEICVDQPKKISKKDLDNLPIKILSNCALFVPDLVGLGVTPPLNLFRAIAAIYKCSNEGVVKSLSFRTPHGSVKKERMVSFSDDLRKELFHHAGMDAVHQEIYPYEIEISWDFKIPANGSATLELSALIKEISSATPTLFGCYINASSIVSFSQSINKLVSYTG